jgi:histidinol-phosphate phosphatase family protein
LHVPLIGWGANKVLLRILFSELRTRTKGPAIFLDRDGVINCRRPNDYVLDWSQFEFVPGIREALKQLSSLRLPMIVISNQAAVGKGLLTSAGLEEITARMNEALLADDTSLAAAYYCPHRIEDHCICRKPKPALLFTAATDFNADLSRSIFVGDSKTDIEAARAANCEPVLFDAVLRGSADAGEPKADRATTSSAEELFNVVKKFFKTRN